MISAWTKNCKSEEEKKQFENVLRGSSVVLERLIELLREDQEALSKKEVSSKVYENPNWAYLQAHANGYSACLNAYLKLLTLDREDKNEHPVRPGQRQSDVGSQSSDHSEVER